MPDNQEPTLQELEAQFREEAAQADIAESADSSEASIGDNNSGAAADPVQDDSADQSENNNPSDNGGDGGGEPSGGNPEGGDGANSDEGGDSEADTPEPTAPKTKAQKEQERRDRSWKKLQQERADFLREKAEFEASKLAQSQSQETNPAVNPEALARSYDELAKQFEDAGDFENADEARNRATQLRARESAPVRGRETTPTNNPQFMAAWAANVERAKHDFPEMQDENSQFGKTVTALLRAPDLAPFLSGRPDGAYIAAQLAQMKSTASRVPVLEKENAALKEEIKKLRQGMTLPDSGASARAGTPKSFDSMSLAEQEAYLRRQAEYEDASPRPAVY